MSEGELKKLLDDLIKNYPPQGAVYKNGGRDTARLITESSIKSGFKAILDMAKADFPDISKLTNFESYSFEVENWCVKWFGKSLKPSGQPKNATITARELGELLFEP